MAMGWILIGISGVAFAAGEALQLRSLCSPSVRGIHNRQNFGHASRVFAPENAFIGEPGDIAASIQIPPIRAITPLILILYLQIYISRGGR